MALSAAQEALAKWLEENPRNFQQIIDLRVKEVLLRNSDAILNRFMPLTTTNDLDIVTAKFRGPFDMRASVVAFDGDLPTKRPNSGQVEYQNFTNIKHGLQDHWGEQDIIDATRAAAGFAAATGDFARAMQAAFARHLLPRVENYPQYCLNSLESITWEALYSGQFTWNDSQDSVGNYTRSYGASPTQFRAYVPAEDWSNVATPGLSIIEQELDTAYARAGRYPKALVLQQREVRDLLKQTETKDRITAMLGYALNPGQVSNFFVDRAMVQDYLTRYTNSNGVELLVMADKREDIDRSGNGFVYDLIPKGKAVFLWDSEVRLEGQNFFAGEIAESKFMGGTGSRVIGPHPSNGMRPGFFINNRVDRQSDPFRAELSCSVVAIPYIPNPELLQSFSPGNPV